MSDMRNRAASNYMSLPPLLLRRLQVVREAMQERAEVPSFCAGDLERVGLAVWRDRRYFWVEETLGDMEWVATPTEEMPDRGYFCWASRRADSDMMFLRWLLLQVREADLPYITVECAFTSTWLEPESCGGSAAFIIRNGISQIGTYDWLARQAAEYKDGRTS